MIAAFKVGERIFKPGTPASKYATIVEGPRYAEVIKTYNGKPSAIDPGVPFMDVKFEDNGEIKIGCINMVGVFTETPLIFPSVWPVNENR